MRKLISIAIVLILVVICFSSCKKAATEEKSNRISIVSTIFPTYDFAKQICADKAEITQLLPLGSESHTYEPTPQDIITVQNCDLFIYVGGEGDAWVEDILHSMSVPVKTVKMMNCVDTVEEKVIEGMEAEENETTEKEKGPELDEHVWTSPKNAAKITQAITDAVCEIDPINKSLYQENSSAYLAELSNLDKSFTDFFAAVSNKLIIVGDRFPLRYFADEYGIKYYAAFPGCSCQTDPSAATIAFLIDKVKTEKVKTVFYMEFSNHLVADSIAEATGTKTAALSAAHNVTATDLAAGVTYISLMEKNLAVLKEAMK